MKTLRRIPPHTRRTRPRGSVVVLAAFLLLVVFAMVAFAIDVGYILHVNTELQRTADACALAAVRRLPGRAEAVLAAQHSANRNKGTEGPELRVSNVEFGTWDPDTATFRPQRKFRSPNAVRVTVERSAANGNPLRLFFAPVLGTSHTDVSATAIAIYDRNLSGPLIGIDGITIPGRLTTDSFRSSQGRYSPRTARDNGNLASDGPIRLGRPVINGDAQPGRGFETTVQGDALVTGTVSPRLRPLHLPGVSPGLAAEINDNKIMPKIPRGNGLSRPIDAGGSFRLGGNITYDLPPGLYYFNDLSLFEGATVNITGPTTIYLTGNLEIEGGFLLNTLNSAGNLRILMAGWNTTASVTLDADLYAVLYAPHSSVQIQGSAQFFGAIVGRTLYASGTSRVHYDEDIVLDDLLALPRRVSLVK